MGRKKRSNNQVNDGSGHQGIDAKKLKPETGESFLVKKYRPDKMYPSMEAFVRYTKSHRMLDASYIRWNTGVTPEKPFVFSTRVGGADLGWGRGKTRDAAVDCACRATFSLVNAHGYKNFTIDEDCLLEAPVDLPPPPPPPPLPPIAPPLPPFPPGVHHPPLGTIQPPLPPGAPPLPPATDLIPQPQLQDQAPVPTSLATTRNFFQQQQQQEQQHQNAGSATAQLSTSNADTNTALQPPPPPPSATAISLNLKGTDTASKNPVKVVAATVTPQQQLKGGLILVYNPGAEGEELSMEERRASQSRYQEKLQHLCLKS